MLDSLTITLAILASDGRAQPMQGIEIRPTVWQVVERSTATVSRPELVASIDTRPKVAVEAPSIWGDR